MKKRITIMVSVEEKRDVMNNVLHVHQAKPSHAGQPRPRGSAQCVLRAGCKQSPRRTQGRVPALPSSRLRPQQTEGDSEAGACEEKRAPWSVAHAFHGVTSPLHPEPRRSDKDLSSELPPESLLRFSRGTFTDNHVDPRLPQVSDLRATRLEVTGALTCAASAHG